MISQEITQLRKAGKLEEALEKADQALVEDSNNIWNKRTAAWVYYEYLKKYSQVDTFSFDDFKEYLTRIKDLKLPEDEKMVFDNCAWKIGSLVFTLCRSDQIDYKKINELFKIIKEFHFTKPSEAYSFIYKAFHKGYHNWSNYLSFADWWDFHFFRSEDYLKEEYNGKKIMSTAEQAIIAYSKKLLEGEHIQLSEIGPGDFLYSMEKSINKEKVHSFLPLLDKIIHQHPDYQYPPYFKAKLLLALGEDENILSAFLPFARQKRNDFWVWELVAEIFKEDQEIQFACHCKALSLNTQEDFLVKTRQAFATLLIAKDMYSEAKFEIEKTKETYENHGWNVPPQINEWIDQAWYQSTQAALDNNNLYTKHSQRAEDILFADIEPEEVAVEFVNSDRKILNFIKNRNHHGFFNYDGKIINPEIGNIFNVRLKKIGNDGYYSLLTASLSCNTTCQTIKTFYGELKIIQNLNIGFVDKIFIEPRLIQENNLNDGQSLTGKAILSFNKKKNEWGWKAFQIDKQ